MHMYRLLRSTALVCVCFVASLTAQTSSESIVGYWSGTVEREGKLWRVEMKAVLQESEIKTTVTFVDLDIPDVPFPVKRTDRGFRLERPQPSGNPIVFDGVVENNTFKGAWVGFGVEGKFTMRRSAKPESAYREEEVIFTNGGVKLAGTLVIPVGNGRYPAVVITHGSSPNERAAYRSWGRGFAQAGIAALIYDKRGAGNSTGNTRAASMQDLAGDAIAGVHLLARRPDIDAKKIGVAGHSQGGWIAPLAAFRSKDVAFVIASAAAAVTPAEQSIYHRAGVMRDQGISDAEIEHASKLRQRLYDLNRMILANEPYQKERAAISHELIAQKDARWFSPAELPPQLAGELPPRGALELLFFDPAPVWRKLKVPALVVWGDKDNVVPVEKSRQIIERMQAEAGNEKLKVQVFRDVDHGNNIVRSDSQWDFPRVSLTILNLSSNGPME